MFLSLILDFRHIEDDDHDDHDRETGRTTEFSMAASYDKCCWLRGGLVPFFFFAEDAGTSGAPPSTYHNVSGENEVGHGKIWMKLSFVFPFVLLPNTFGVACFFCFAYGSGSGSEALRNKVNQRRRADHVGTLVPVGGKASCGDEPGRKVWVEGICFDIPLLVVLCFLLFPVGITFDSLVALSR